MSAGLGGLHITGHKCEQKKRGGMEWWEGAGGDSYWMSQKRVMAFTEILKERGDGRRERASRMGLWVKSKHPNHMCTPEFHNVSKSHFQRVLKWHVSLLLTGLWVGLNNSGSVFKYFWTHHGKQLSFFFRHRQEMREESGWTCNKVPWLKSSWRYYSNMVHILTTKSQDTNVVFIWDLS